MAEVYATTDDFDASPWADVPEVDLPTGAARDAALERASRALDAFLGVGPGGIDTSTLDDDVKLRLVAACVAQVVYEAAISADDLIEGPPRILSAGGLSFASQPP